MSDKPIPTALYKEGQPVSAFDRLVALVPEADLDEIRLARRLRALMTPYKTGILLLTPVWREEQEALGRRRLTNLAAILHDPHYQVTCQTLIGRRWLDQTVAQLLPGDLLVCLQGHHAPRGGLKNSTVAEALVGRVTCPLYVIDGVRVEETHEKALSHLIIGWLVPIVMILLFFGFDVDIARDASAGWVGALLLWIVLLIEVGLLWGWNSLWD